MKLITIVFIICLNIDIKEYLKLKKVQFNFLNKHINYRSKVNFSLKQNIEYNGDINLEFLNINSYVILTKFLFGKEKKEFFLVFDTGSFDLWLTSENCENCNLDLNKFNCIDNNYCIKTNKTESIDYISGAVSGNLSKTKLYIEDLSMKKFLINFYNFLLVNKKSKEIKNSMLEGVIGFGLKSLFNSKNIPLYLERPYLTIDFKKENNKNDFFSIGNLRFSKNKPKTDINWINNNNSNLFILNIYYILVDSDLMNRLNYPFVVDTGSSFILFPNFIFDRIVNNFESNEGVKCFMKEVESILFCENYNSSIKLVEIFPKITFRINFNSYSVPAESYVDLCEIKNKKETCMIKLSNSNSNFGILGLTFLNNFTTVLDYKNNKIGFYNKDIKKIKHSLNIFYLIIFIVIIFIIFLYFKNRVSNPYGLYNANLDKEML